MVKIGIVGQGVVGGALSKSFQEHNIDFQVYDKFKNIGQAIYLVNCDIVFLCLPTLYNVKLKSYDKSAIHDNCSFLSENQFKGLVVIKSTVEPGTTADLSDKYCINIVHNPEFLSAKTAYEDFHHQSHIVIGKTQNVNQDKLQLLIDFFKKYYSDGKINLCTSTESESVKIFCNSFYAVKIQFFNELFLLCNEMNINYDKIKYLMIENNWINPMHTQVPGQDGQLSFGGMCLPKDSNALLSFMKNRNTPHHVLDAVIKERNTMRN